MKRMRRSRPAARILAHLGLAALLCAPCVAGDWSRFRGPNGSGVARASRLPAELGPETNVAWRAPVPFGRSSPAVGERLVFLTGIEDDRLTVVALERASGSEVWRRTVERGHRAELHSATDSAVSSPATDGENVYAFFHEAGLVSFDGDGRQRWRRPLGPFRNYYAIAASPVLAGERVVMLCDQGQGSFLAAFDSATGEELWRRQRPGRREAFTTPILLADGSLVVSGSRWVDAYDPATGETLWELGGVGTGPVSSPVSDGERLFVNAVDQASHAPPPFSQLAREHDRDGDGEIAREELDGSWMQKHFLWINGDGAGGISEEDWRRHLAEIVNDRWGAFAILPPRGEQPAEILWNYRQNVPYIPSPLVHDGVFYMVKDGIVTSLDAATGEQIRRGRIGDGSPEVYASPVAADGKLYVATLDGRVAVLELAGEWRVLAVNDLGEEIHATPAIADDRLLVRTRTSLYAFAAPPAEGAAAAGPE